MARGSRRSGRAPLRIFLDAKILFSASLRGPAFELLWDLSTAGKVLLLTSAYCLAEARTNIERKRPEAKRRLAALVSAVEIVPSPGQLVWASELVGSGDAHVLAAAVDARADVLLTGDLKHFGSLMERADLPLRVRTLRAFLLE